MKKNTEQMHPDKYYHVYNRGINGESLFKSERNYGFFLKKYAYHIDPIATTYAYCLLNNHFHLMIKTRTEEEIAEWLTRFKFSSREEKSASFLISNQFAKLFNCYTQALNKSESRTGGLFETPFRRKEVKDEAYYSQLIWYIHYNPQKHGFVNNFQEYRYSSYLAHLNPKENNLQSKEVLKWFGSEKEYIDFHLNQTLNVVEVKNLDDVGKK